MNNTTKAVLVAGLGYVVYRVLITPSATGTVTEKLSNFWSGVVNMVTPGAWLTSDNASTYVPYINSVESDLGIPQNLLARIAYEESHFRTDIVTGATKSSAGAVGLMQLEPSSFPGKNVGANWQADVQWAGAYLVQLFDQFQDWQVAVAAYNDGPGNIDAYLAGSRSLPLETQQYVADVIGDVPLAGSLVDVGNPVGRLA